VVDVSGQYCTLGLWGPKAPAVLEAATRDDVSPKALPSWRASDITIGYVPALALRVSYVGEPGFEIHAPTECGPELWDRLWRAGEAHQIIAAGNGALDSLRLERGRRLWGADIDPETNPYEAGLGRVVRLAKGDFVGRAAAEGIEAEGPARTLSCMTLDEPDAVLMGKEPILADGQVLGYVTSTNYGYTVGRQIAYGYLPAARAKAGEKVEIEYFGRRHPATVAREPLLDAAGRRARS
jgi:dimethylglycine oxidase